MTAQEIVQCVERLQRLITRVKFNLGRHESAAEFALAYDDGGQSIRCAEEYAARAHDYATRAAHEAHILLRLAEGREA